jgi:hypothetical protein
MAFNCRGRVRTVVEAAALQVGLALPWWQEVISATGFKKGRKALRILHKDCMEVQTYKMAPSGLK